MRTRIGLFSGVLAILTALPCPASACTLCTLGFRTTPTLRLEAGDKRAQLVVHGRVISSKYSSDVIGNGISQFRITKAFKVDNGLPGAFQFKQGDVIALPRWVPVKDKKNPPRYLVYAEVDAGRLDPFRAEEILSDDVVKYLSGAMKLDPANKKEMLLYYFQYLEHGDPKIAMDAFLEFARASDEEVGAVAGELDATRVRRWLTAKTTPPERLGLYAFLLGANGAKEDATLLRSMIDKRDARTSKALDGLLSGYALMEPDKGWQLTYRLLGDPKTSDLDLLVIHRMLRFYYGWQPKKMRPRLLEALKVMVKRTAVVDVAIEDLRNWQMWDVTPDVLALYGRGGPLDSPLIKRTIVRYALQCPRAEAKQFISKVRAREKDLVEEVEEQLELERSK